MFLFMVSLFIPPDVYGLSHQDWRTREFCEFRCRLCWPVIFDRLNKEQYDSDDSESRERAYRILNDYRTRNEDKRADLVLDGILPPNINDFWFDEQLRIRVYHRMLKRGLGDTYITRGILPQTYDGWNGFFSQLCPAVVCYEHLLHCRNDLRTEYPWFLKLIP